jgi:hypothetical protein
MVKFKLVSWSFGGLCCGTSIYSTQARAHTPRVVGFGPVRVDTSIGVDLLKVANLKLPRFCVQTRDFFLPGGSSLTLT